MLQKIFQAKSLVFLRNLVQTGYSLFLLWIGYQFYRFVAHFETFGATPYVKRPPAVEGFLPINALVSLKSWVANGIFDLVHPAGLAIFLAVILVSLLFKKGFCSWICPVGTLSEGLWRGGKKLFKRNFALPRFLDWPLLAVKYLLLAFFLRFIWFGMDAQAAYVFTTQIPYIKVADVKMLDFFLNLSGTAALILGGLAIASLLIKNFWCRYLCPYGALLGLASIFSPLKITRNAASCTSCGQCTKACPNYINVAAKGRVSSPECSGCLNCVAACPAQGALAVALPGKKEPGEKGLSFPWPRVNLPPWSFPVLLLGTFLLVIVIAKATGHWETIITTQEYQFLIPQRNMFNH